MPIEAKGLTHIYMPGTPFESRALDDVSFSIPDGMCVGLIGHTGSGKSTLVQHLNGLLKPTGGSLAVDGVRVGEKGQDLRELRRHVGLVFQYPEYQLFEETVIKDVCFGPRNLGESERDAREHAAEALRLSGLTDESLWEKSPFELSGGQKRRVAIAGVVAMRPSTLILDEPTAGLDPAGREEILSLVAALHARGGTLIMVSHGMAEVARLCDRLLVMNKGSLALDGTPEQVFSGAETLRKIGLEPPPCAYLRDLLRARGFEGLPDDAVRRETLVPAILRAFGKEAAPC